MGDRCALPLSLATASVPWVLSSENSLYYICVFIPIFAPMMFSFSQVHKVAAVSQINVIKNDIICSYVITISSQHL